jgi:hypothetical protein
METKESDFRGDFLSDKSRDGLLFVAIKFPESLIVNDTLGI